MRQIELSELDLFCDELPEPIIAQVIVVPTPRKGWTLKLDCNGEMVTVVEDGQPCAFTSVDALMYILRDLSNVNSTTLRMDCTSYRLNC